MQTTEPLSFGSNRCSPTYQQCEFWEICSSILGFSLPRYKVGIKILLISKGYCEDQVTPMSGRLDHWQALKPMLAGATYYCHCGRWARGWWTEENRACSLCPYDAYTLLG